LPEEEAVLAPRFDIKRQNPQTEASKRIALITKKKRQNRTAYKTWRSKNTETAYKI